MGCACRSKAGTCKLECRELALEQGTAAYETVCGTGASQWTKQSQTALGEQNQSRWHLRRVS